MPRISSFKYSLINCVFAKFFGGKTEKESELNIGFFKLQKYKTREKEKRLKDTNLFRVIHCFLYLIFLFRFHGLRNAIKSCFFNHN